MYIVDMISICVFLFCWENYSTNIIVTQLVYSILYLERRCAKFGKLGFFSLQLSSVHFLCVLLVPK